MKKSIIILFMAFFLLSCWWEKQYNYSWVSNFEDGQQEIQPAKIEILDTEVQ